MAGTWAEAERFAQAERDLRDPVNLELRKIAAVQETEEERVRALEANQMGLEDATERWLNSQKDVSDSTVAIYRGTVRKSGRLIKITPDSSLNLPRIQSVENPHSAANSIGEKCG